MHNPPGSLIVTDPGVSGTTRTHPGEEVRSPLHNHLVETRPIIVGVNTMATALRKTGISVVGDLPWGAHFCYFYETKQDLLDVLIPYFKTGLENREFCLWVISNSELLTVPEATSALRNALPDLDRYVADRSIEVVGHEDWFLSGNAFDPNKVANRFRMRLNEALARGYAGMRVNGSPAWLHDAGPQELRKFEAELDKLFPNERTIASCTYPLASIGGEEIFDVVRTHQFAIARRQGKWEVVETPELIQAKAEIRRLNEGLEQRILERTRELAAANEELRTEILERKQAEDALRRSEDRNRLIIDTIPTMAWSLRPDGVVDFLNQRWMDYTGLSLEQYVKDPTGPIHPEDIPRVIERWLVEMAVGEAYEEEMRLRRADGEYRWFLVRTAPLRDEQGDLVKWYGVSTDIEDLKRAEAALKESQRRLEEAQRIAHVGHWDRDLETRRITWSDEIYRILGLPLQERDSPRTEWLEVVHPEDKPRLSLSIEELERGIRRLDVEFRIVRPNGEVRFLHSQGDVIRDERGRPLRRFGTAQDITERKRAEEQLKATTEQLRALSARLQSAKEQEGIRIARELHDELGSELSSLRWDLEDVYDAISKFEDRSQIEESLQKMTAMMRLAETTINNVRRISSELRPIALDDLGLTDAIEWQARQFQERTGIMVECDCTLENVDLTREQSTAAFRISQEALTNILRHAQATRVHIQLNKENGDLVLTISDNGRGITEAEKSGQSRLGLLGMRERAHLVGGKIEIAGSKDKGTLVTLRFPIVGAGLTFEARK